MNAFDTARKSAVEMQRAYYARTAHCYDEMHLHEDDEHGFALRFMISVVEHLEIQSILEIGCGTGLAEPSN
jgi:ubiquinone/menaquinone biosynthesis C-methylase UbiE